MLGVILALIAGAFMSIQGVFNTRVTEVSSPWVSNTIVHFLGLMVCIVAWLIVGRPSFKPLINIEHKYYLLGGLLGALIVLFVIKSMSALGPAYSVMLILITQVTVAYGIELLGLFGTDVSAFEPKKLIGVGLMIVGIIVFKL
jgi:transporter family-2 protein